MSLAQVRFFERVKLERRIKKLKASLPAALSAKQETLLAALEEDLQVRHICHLKCHCCYTSLLLLAAAENSSRASLLTDCAVQYVKYFPPGRKYISILKDAPDPEGQARLDAERQLLRGLARQRRADEALMAEPDEGCSLDNKGPVTSQVARVLMHRLHCGYTASIHCVQIAPPLETPGLPICLAASRQLYLDAQQPDYLARLVSVGVNLKHQWSLHACMSFHVG